MPNFTKIVQGLVQGFAAVGQNSHLKTGPLSDSLSAVAAGNNNRENNFEAIKC